MIKINFGDIELDYNTVLFETVNFFVIDTLGSIGPGHLLIIPKFKYRCLSELPDELQKEFLELKEIVRDTLSRNFSEPFFLEYGIWGQSVAHAHLHCIPLKGREYSIDSFIDEHVKTNKIKFIDFSFENMERVLREKGGYVYIEEFGKGIVCFPEGPFDKETTKFHYRRFFTDKGVSGILSWKNMSEEDKRVDDARRELTKKIFRKLNV